jgi:hypothetical protein
VTLWKLLAHITIPPTNPSSRGATYGYLNVVTWADSAHAAQAKVTTHFKTLNWQIPELRAHPYPRRRCPKQRHHRTSPPNPKAITHGTFHSYRPS